MPRRTKASKIFASRLRGMRLENELTQAQAARKCRPKISQSRWCDYESGRRMPTIDTADRLARAVGSELWALLWNEE